MSKDLEKAVSDAQIKVLAAQREQSNAIKSKDQTRITAANAAVKLAKSVLGRARAAKVREETALSKRKRKGV